MLALGLAHPPAEQSYSSSAPSLFLMFVFSCLLPCRQTYSMFYSGKGFNFRNQSSGHIFKCLFLSLAPAQICLLGGLTHCSLRLFLYWLFVYNHYNIDSKQKHFKAVLYNKLFFWYVVWLFLLVVLFKEQSFLISVTFTYQLFFFSWAVSLVYNQDILPGQIYRDQGD